MFSIHCNSRVKSWWKQKDPQRIQIKPFINKYNWEWINFPIEYHLSEICHNFADNAFYGSKQNLGSF